MVVKTHVLYWLTRNSPYPLTALQVHSRLSPEVFPPTLAGLNTVSSMLCVLYEDGHLLRRCIGMSTRGKKPMYEYFWSAFLLTPVFQNTYDSLWRRVLAWIDQEKKELVNTTELRKVFGKKSREATWQLKDKGYLVKVHSKYYLRTNKEP